MLGVKVPPQHGHDTDLPLNISSTEAACESLSDGWTGFCVVISKSSSRVVESQFTDSLYQRKKIIALISQFDYGGNPFCAQQDKQNLT
jgi:hypothetical protein